MSLISLSDSSAPLIVGGILVQVTVLAMVVGTTLLKLRRQRKQIVQLATSVERVHSIEEAQPPTERSLVAAWQRLLRSQRTPGKEATEPREALHADALLPRGFNARLDAAAPGLFTALGILGTFVGLIVAFGHVDPTQSEQSIGPLVSGMSSAFWNSLVGVLFSVVFTFFSKRERHNFEVACKDLIHVVDNKIDRVTAGDQVLHSLDQLAERLSWIFSETKLARLEAIETRTEIVEGIVRVEAATENSSTELLTKLAPQLEQVFKTLVDAPFENLSRTVTQFQQSVEQVAERHGYVIDALDAAVLGLGAAQHAMSVATADAADAVVRFETFVEKIGAESERASKTMSEQMTEASSVLRDQLENSARMVAIASETVVASQGSIDAIRTASERQSDAASAMGAATAGLDTASAELNGIATTFGNAASRLEAAADRIKNVAAEAAADSTRIARAELQNAVKQMAEALKEFGEQNVLAYENSSQNVIDAVDNQMSDLTERLSAELNTLMVRLPDVANSMTSAAKSVRVELDRAIKGLGSSVHQLDVASRQSLNARLEEYDGAVAQAVDHFSGTLIAWDGKVAELTGAVRQFETAVARKDGRTDAFIKLEAPQIADVSIS